MSALVHALEVDMSFVTTSSTITVSSSKGELFGYDLGFGNMSGNTAYLTAYFYDDATPTYGTTTPVFEVLIPTQSSKTWFSAQGIKFNTAITLIITNSNSSGSQSIRGFIQYE